jgi:selenocysteine lyase/cysteine desulfurase
MSVSRSLAGQLLNCDPDDVCFIKSTTHGILIVANSINWVPGDNVVGLAHEFPANIHPWKSLAQRGVEFRIVPERQDYTYDLSEIAARIDSRTRLLAVSWVEYSTGVRNNLEALSSLCRERNIMFCVDAIQGLGVVPVDLQSLHVDFLMADGHKWLLAPEGTGILYVRRERIPELNESMCGWCGLKNPQEYDNYDQPYKPNARRFEEGSHNLMSIIALGSSLRLLLEVGIPVVQARIQELTDELTTKVRQKNYEVITPENPQQRAGIVSFYKKGIDPMPIALALQREQKIMIAARRGFFRASPHFYNDSAELEQLVSALP